MSWFKGKQAPKRVESGTIPHHGPHVAREVHDRIAHFLQTHDRVEMRGGHPLMHFLGVTQNHLDGTVDYSVRSRIRRDGKEHRFDSHIRIYPSGHLRLIR